MKKLKTWALLIAARFFGAFAIVIGFYVLDKGDPFTPIFLMIPGAFLLAIPVLETKERV